MATQPFQWFGNQAITSPEQAQRKRAIAEALIGQSATPANNWSEGLADVAAALSGTILEGRVSDAEEAGRERAGGLFANLALNQDPNSIIAALTSPDAAWGSPTQTSIATALLDNSMRQNDPMYQLQMEKLRSDIAQAGQGGNESFFGNIVPMQDANGNVVLGQASNQGNWQPLQGAEGYSPAPTTKQIDTGTEIITTDVYGNELYRTPKQNREAASQSAFGTVEGRTEAENIAAAESIASKLPGLRNVVAELSDLAKTATYTQTGQLIDNVTRELGGEMSPAAIARAQYIAMVDNQVLPLLRDTFGAAFTQKEGETLRATLGNANASPVEKQAILEAFIAQKERDVAGMQSNMPGGSPLPTPTQNSGGAQDWQTYFGAQ